MVESLRVDANGVGVVPRTGEVDPLTAADRSLGDVAGGVTELVIIVGGVMVCRHASAVAGGGSAESLAVDDVLGLFASISLRR